MSQPTDKPPEGMEPPIKKVREVRNPDGSLQEAVFQGTPAAIAEGLKAAGIEMVKTPEGYKLSKPESKPDENTMASVIDTIEAILIALILALTFRAFVVEAFVIPTGSMAPSLLGAHFNAICPRCGYAFTADANLKFQYDVRSFTAGIYDEGRGELKSNSTIPCDSDTTFCPNCSFVINPKDLPQYLDSRKVQFDARKAAGNVEFAWANNGDRILVLKYLYSILPPQRWDVIVFKEPVSAHDNYIKRLIGLPNETLEIVNGDIFVGPPEKRPQPGRVADPRDLQIARKPPHIQQALWQLVYDNDFYPVDRFVAADRNPIKWVNPWTGASSTAKDWTINSPVITYAANTAGTAVFDARDHYALNTLGYNHDIGESIEFVNDVRRVGDLRLECTWIPAAHTGRTIALVVGLPRNQYRAVWTADGLVLSRFDFSAQPPAFVPVKTIAARDLPELTAGRGYHVALNNVDHAVQVFIDGKAVLEHITPWSAADARAEKEQSEQTREYLTQKPDIRIEVEGACTLAHLKVMRDLYYTQMKIAGVAPGTATTDNPLTLNSEEYFALGDNSRKSLDGRAWTDVYPALDDLGTRRGIVPQRYLLGKAFFVYWPAGYRPTEKVPLLKQFPIVPNAGDMRFIR